MRQCGRSGVVAVAVMAVCGMLAAAAVGAEGGRDYNVLPVPFNHVEVSDGFWGPRLETNRMVTIPYAFEMCEETGRISNFEKAAGMIKGKFEGIYFNDSDVYKVMEGAAYSLQVNPERMMRLYLDKLVEIMGAAQWEDGYLYTFYTVGGRQPEKRWTEVGATHEQYCMGHMYEAAAAHYQVTGKRDFLDIAIKSADLICEVFGEGKRTDPPGHEEIEIGLCKLYRATGDVKYLNQAKFFLDQRGRLGNRRADGKGGLYGMYAQDHIPVTEQTKAVGHSVRAAYLYTGMADVAALTGDMKYVKAIEAIWQDVVGTKLYITGGIGAEGGSEGFGGEYELPNMRAYCETCASVANILWNHRMFMMTGEGRYMDVLERTLYNAALSGISMTGDRFFYPNPLESNGQHERSPWFGCACCPSNVARFIPSVPGFVYAHKGADVYVNLFVGGSATIETDGNKVKVSQETRYPWDGKVKITVEPEKSGEFAVKVRMPGWAGDDVVASDLYRFVEKARGEVRLAVNGEAVKVSAEKGYASVERRWQAGDVVEMELPMEVRRVLANEKVEDDRGRVAVERGPIVYCLEWCDNGGEVLDMYVPDDAVLKAEYREDLLNGVMTIRGAGRKVRRTPEGGIVTEGEKAFVMIPYYAWAHRGLGQMTVWPARAAEKAKAGPGPTMTYKSKTSASFVHVSLDAIKDQNVPRNSGDSSSSQLDFWPHKGSNEWLRFAWDAKQKISSVKVYWFDDTGRGECHLPQAWRVLYRDKAGEFKPVANKADYPIEKDRFCKVEFGAVETDCVKIEVDLQKVWSAGIQEVVIE